MARRKKGSVKETDTVVITNVDLATADVTGVLPVANGGTGSGSYTDGQLLIGNTGSGNTLTKATLTAGSNITITNGGGSITIASTGGSSTNNIVFDQETGTPSTTTNTWHDTNLSVSITPSATSSKVLVRALLHAGATHSVHFRLADGSGNPLTQGDTNSNRARTHGNAYLAGTSPTLIHIVVMEYLHSPNSTSAQTYKVQWRFNTNTSGTAYMNRAGITFSDNDAWPVCVSTLVAEEKLQ